MNVFLLDEDHCKRARYHCDTHVNKMLLESVQILNTALHINGDEDETFYASTHENHPWCQWAAKSDANWVWLSKHAHALGWEFEDRNGKPHTSHQKMLDAWSPADTMDVIGADGEPTEFPICTGDYVPPESAGPVESYRRYYVRKKVPEDWCSWSNGVPDWVIEMQ